MHFPWKIKHFISMPCTLFRHICPLLLALLAMAGALHAKEVVLRNKDGKSLTARLVSITGDKLSVMRESDKKQFTLDLTQLDDASRGKVDDWVKAGGNLSERYVVELSSGKSGKNSPYDYDDERTVSMEPVIVVKNPDVNIPTKAAKVTVLILGRPVRERGAYYVFSTETFDLPSLDGGKQQSFLMKKFRHSYDDRGSYKFGSRYLGWVVLVHDSEDKRIMHSQSVPAPLAAKFSEKFLGLTAEKTYDSELQIMKYVN
jgi:hypothetical protein